MQQEGNRTMIYSMTGYGRARCALNGREITVELRCVNSRYLDISIKLHRSYTFAEDKIKAYLQSRVSRGKLDSITVSQTPHGGNCSKDI